MVRVMSEVQRITVLWPVGPHGYGNYPVVLASEYDAQRLRADTAEAELKRLDSLDTMQLIAELTKRNAAADQRIAEMKKALERIKFRLEVFIEDDHAMMPASLEVTLGIANAALNPNPEAESHE